MSEDLVLKKIEGTVGVAVLNRPPVNALSASLLEAIRKVLEAWEKDDAVRCVVITGTGSKIFCAGADIKEIKEAILTEKPRELVARGQSLFALIECYPKPVIAGLNGLALGGGFELALACHLRVASETSRIGLPEIQLGIMPGFGGTQRLARLAPLNVAVEWVLSGRQVDIHQALGLGIVNAVFPADGFEKGLADFAAGLAAKPPLAVREALRAVRKSSSPGGMEAELEGFCALSRTQDALEGLNAMLEKRPPQFKGQ